MVLVRTKFHLNKKDIERFRRQERLKELLYSIRKDKFGQYTVESSHDMGTTYTVFWYSKKKAWICTCKYFSLYQKTCVHIDAVKQYDSMIGKHLDDF